MKFVFSVQEVNKESQEIMKRALEEVSFKMKSLGAGNAIPRLVAYMMREPSRDNIDRGIPRSIFLRPNAAYL